MNQFSRVSASNFAGFSRSRNEKVTPCKSRIVRAIKKGNHELKYIVEFVTAGSLGNLAYELVMGEAIKELRSEGKIKYNELLEGYYLA